MPPRLPNRHSERSEESPFTPRSTAISAPAFVAPASSWLLCFAAQPFLAVLLGSPPRRPSQKRHPERSEGSAFRFLSLRNVSIHDCHPESCAFCRSEDLNRSFRGDHYASSHPLPDISSLLSDIKLPRSPFRFSAIPVTIYRATTYSPDPARWCYYRSIRLAPHGILRCLGGHA
jgi:hypothetical protein